MASNKGTHAKVIMTGKGLAHDLGGRVVEIIGFEHFLESLNGR